MSSFATVPLDSSSVTETATIFLKLLMKFYTRGATKHKLSTAYHLQTNGLTEHLNRTLSDKLYVSADQRDWDIELPFVTFAYNSARHDTAGFSPSFLLFSCDPTLPFDTVLPASLNFTSEYARKAILKAQEERHLARRRLVDSQENQRHLYETRHCDAHNTPGPPLVPVATR